MLIHEHANVDINIVCTCLSNFLTIFTQDGGFCITEIPLLFEPVHVFSDNVTF